MISFKPMTFNDDEIESQRSAEQKKTNAAKQVAVERRAALREFKVRAKAAKKVKDRVGFERLLDAYDVKRNSEHWKTCWEYFYSDET